MSNRSRHFGLRTALVALLMVVGTITIVGSGGGGSVGFLGGDPCANNGCNPGPIVFANVTPGRSTVQAGTQVVLSASSTGLTPPAYQWRRSTDGVNFTDIPGETAATYSFTARLVDDGTVYGVRVSGTGGLQAVASAYLAVASSAPVVFADTEFADGDWSASSTATATEARIVSQSQATSGGNPGAWRHAILITPPGSSTISAFNLARAAVFDPATRGALRAIDYSHDCTIQSSTPSTFSTSVLLVQGGRSFGTKNLPYCNSPGWTRITQTALAAADFMQVAGPACTANEICPDFSASGGQIMVGYVQTTQAQGNAAATSFDRGIDNWRVSLWPR